MRLFDAFGEPEDTLSLAEEAALHAPPLYEAPVVSPEGLTALPEDFPVLDPFEQRESVKNIVAIMHRSAVCKTKDCALDDRYVLAREAAEMAVDAIGEMQVIAATLFAHGETLVSEQLVECLCILAQDVLKPFFDSAGINPVLGDDDE